MTDLLGRPVAAVRALPADVQDDVARTLLQWTGQDQPPIALTPEEEASFAESLAQADRGDFATDEHVRAAWAKHGL